MPLLASVCMCVTKTKHAYINKQWEASERASQRAANADAKREREGNERANGPKCRPGRADADTGTEFDRQCECERICQLCDNFCCGRMSWRASVQL